MKRFINIAQRVHNHFEVAFEFSKFLRNLLDLTNLSNKESEENLSNIQKL